MISAGNRLATIAAEVTVPEVSRMRILSARNLLDQGRRRQHFADAGAVNPDQRSVRPDVPAHAAPLADPRRILLALLQPPLDQRRRQRHHGRGQPAIERAASSAAD